MNPATPVQLNDLLSAAETGATLLTSGARLAAYLGDAYAQQRMAAGDLAWEAPNIMSWSGWISDAAETLRLRGLLAAAPGLSGLQERALWAAIIQDSIDNPLGLSDPFGTAARAQEARRLAIVWRARFDRNATGLNPDAETWLEWNRVYEQRLRASGWRESAQLPDELAALVEAGDWIPEGPIILTGFDDLTPQQQAFWDCVGNAGVEVKWCERSGQAETVVRRTCSDARQEVTEIANWARARLETDPAARIGIVAPELEAARGPLESALQEALQPGGKSPLTDSRERRFNISLGRALSEQPIVSCGLKLLRVKAPWLDVDELGQLLDSPFLAGYPLESRARARLGLALREEGENEISLKRIANQAGKQDCPEFARLVGKLNDTQRSGARRAASEWASLFAAELDSLGWARGRPLDSHEYQAAEAFRETMPLLGTLDAVAGKLGRDDATAALARMTREKLFQPRTEASPVQVLGVLESVGMHFDHLWVMGLHDGVWPSAPNPNPFIPLALQRERGLPRSGPKRELEMAEMYTRRLLESARDVVVSFPQMSGDEQLRCSPLIAHLPVVDGFEVPDYSRAWILSIQHSANLRPWVEQCGAPAPAGPVSGGSGLLKAQSACAFRAYVVHRLGARDLPTPDIGLNAMQRGSLVHEVLQLLWEDSGDGGALLELPADQQLQKVDAAVEAALEKVARMYPRSVTPGFKRIEQARLRAFMQRWIELEQQRAPFQVLDCEMSAELEIEGLEISLQIDRVDALADGRKLVIDYKTGNVKPAQWFGERPEDPQLPIYSLAVEEPVAGVAFGILRAEKLEFQGVAGDPDVAPGLKSVDAYKQAPGNWDETRMHWQQVLRRLASEYRDGRADVDPHRYPQTCDYCPVNRYGICRVREKRVAGAGEETADD